MPKNPADNDICAYAYARANPVAVAGANPDAAAVANSDAAAVANPGAAAVANPDTAAAQMAKHLMNRIRGLEIALITSQAEVRASQAEAETAQNRMILLQQHYEQILAAAQFQNALLRQMFQELQGGVQ